MTAAAITAGTSVSRGEASPGRMPANMASPTTTTPAKFGALVNRKNATVRRAMCSVDIPALFRAQTPRARPPAPPVGSSELAASSAIAMS